jgi:MFS family permease
VRGELAEGWRYFRQDPLLRVLAGLVAVFAWCQALVLGPLVLYALDALGLTGVGYGLLVGVAALGNVVGGVAAGRLDRRLGAAVLVPVAGAVAGVAYLGAAGAPGPVLAGLALLVEGMAVSVGNAANLAVRQRIIPAALLGRVGNIFRFFIYGVMPLGALVGGIVAEGIGLRAPFVVAAVVQLVAVAVLGPRFARALRARAVAA